MDAAQSLQQYLRSLVVFARSAAASNNSSCASEPSLPVKQESDTSVANKKCMLILRRLLLEP